MLGKAFILLWPAHGNDDDDKYLSCNSFVEEKEEGREI